MRCSPPALLKSVAGEYDCQQPGGLVGKVLSTASRHDSHRPQPTDHLHPPLAFTPNLGGLSLLLGIESGGAFWL